MHWITDFIRDALLRWGYLTLAIGILGESAGVPLPGETTLMLASFLAHKTHQLSMTPLILIGITAAVVGDNIGFLVGRVVGPHLLRWFTEKLDMRDDVALASDQICHHGRTTVFWARFIFGLRTIAGPVAGALGMPWRSFLLYNVLGAAAWVTSMALTGYAFASKFRSFIDYFEKGSWTVSGAIFLAGFILWRRRKKRFQDQSRANA